MVDPEMELEFSIKTVDYINSVIKKLSKVPKYKTELGQKITLEVDELIKHLDARKAQVNAKIKQISNEIIEMTEVIADATAEDWL